MRCSGVFRATGFTACLRFRRLSGWPSLFFQKVAPHPSENQGIAVHMATNGLILISYLELAHRLFARSRGRRYLGRWYRAIQAGLAMYILVNTALLLTIPTRWQPTALNQYGTLLFYAILTGCCFVGICLAAGRRDAVGRFFIVGSSILLFTQAQIVVHLISLFIGRPMLVAESDRDWLGQFIVGGFIIELLSFSLCLVFRQRQLAVAQAVTQARTDEQLVQERLKAELVQRRLEQEKTDVQLRALQAQVNPHFLFNSLNSLSSLIEDDPERAGQFVNELSVVYRYLLKANRTTDRNAVSPPEWERDEPLTTLADELDFIQSYYHLLKTRYGNGLDLRIQVKADYQTALIPPLTLQLLVENAVKHNVVSPKHPLTITITTDEAGQLVVRNNLQRKKTPILSNGVGLSTIATQFQHLRQPAPTVGDQDGFFTVGVPLIKPSMPTESITP